MSAMINSPSVAARQDDATGRSARVAWTVIGLVLALTAVSLWISAQIRTEFQNSYAVIPGHQRTYPDVVRHLVVSVASGSVTIDRGSGSATVVDTTGTKSSHFPSDDEHLVGSTLYVQSTCGSSSFGFSGFCNRDYRVRVPGDVSVTVTVSTGNVFVNGVHGPVKAAVGTGNVTVTGDVGSLAASTQDGTLVVRHEDGSLDASTDTGNVLVADIRGPVNVQSGDGNIVLSGASTSVHLADSTGSIDASGITGSTFSATVGNGPIELSFTTPPHEVDATTQTGSVTVHVPYTDIRYQVHLKTGTGRVVSGVPSDPSSTRVIRVLTGNGDVILGVGAGTPTSPGSPSLPGSPSKAGASTSS